MIYRQSFLKSGRADSGRWHHGPERLFCSLLHYSTGSLCEFLHQLFQSHLDPLTLVLKLFFFRLKVSGQQESEPACGLEWSPPLTSGVEVKGLVPVDLFYGMPPPCQNDHIAFSRSDIKPDWSKAELSCHKSFRYNIMDLISVQ